MSDESTAMEYTIIDDIEVPFQNDSTLAVASQVYFELFNGPDKLIHYTDSKTLFNEANDYADSIIWKCKGAEGDLRGTWTGLFKAALMAEGHEELNTGNIPNVIKMIIRLSRTPPTIFGDDMLMNETSGMFCMHELRGKPRHDILAWIATYELVGKNFHLDVWAPQQLTEEPPPELEDPEEPWEEPANISHTSEVLDPAQVVMEITMQKGGTIKVSRAAKEAVGRSMEAMKSQPTLFYRRRYAVFAVSQVLEKEFMEYAIPNLVDLKPLVWVDINPERPNTWPKPNNLVKAEWAKFRVVHAEILKEKNAEAKADGLPKSGVQSCETYRQRFQEWRFMAAFYRRLYPRYTKQSVYDKMMGSLKFCNGADSIEEKITQDILEALKEAKTYQKQLDRTRQERARIEAELAEAAEAEASTRAEAEAAEKEKQALEEKAKNISVAADPQSTTRRQKKRSQEEQAAEKERLEEKKQEQENKRQRLLHESKKQQQKTAQLQQEKQKWKALPEVVPMLCTKKARKVKKNDIGSLEKINTPRDNMHQDGLQWKPPTFERESPNDKKKKYTKPGAMWEKKSTGTMRLLGRLHDCLKMDEVISMPLKFHTLLSYLGVDDDDVKGNVSFNDRVFVYLIALVLNTYRYVCQLILEFIPCWLFS